MPSGALERAPLMSMAAARQAAPHDRRPVPMLGHAHTDPDLLRPNRGGCSAGDSNRCTRLGCRRSCHGTARRCRCTFLALHRDWHGRKRQEFLTGKCSMWSAVYRSRAIIPDARACSSVMQPKVGGNTGHTASASPLRLPLRCSSSQVIWAAYSPISVSLNGLADPNSSVAYSVQTCSNSACTSGKATVPGTPVCLEHDCPSPTLLTLAAPGLAPSDSVFWCAAPSGRPTSTPPTIALQPDAMLPHTDCRVDVFSGSMLITQSQRAAPASAAGVADLGSRLAGRGCCTWHIHSRNASFNLLPRL